MKKNFEIKDCNNCNLYKNQEPLLDKLSVSDIMWVGLSSKKSDDNLNSIPLQNNTNTGKIIEKIENKIKNYTFYKTNLVKCLPLNNINKIRYPSKEEMSQCINNLLYEISIVKPKLIFLLGRKTYDFINEYFKENKLDTSKIHYIEHPSYIYIYKRNQIDNYVDKVISIVKSNI